MRYNGEVKRFPQLLEFINQHFQIIPVCPEVEAGLSVPRPPVQLTGKLEAHRLIGRDDPSIDVTDALQNYCHKKTLQLNSIHGYIFKSRSPSCGVTDTPLFDNDNNIITYTSGVFARAMLQHYPDLPITDENTLSQSNELTRFLARVKQYQKSQTL